MKKIFLALSLVAMLPACTTLTSPAPLANTTIDEKSLIVALQTFDTALTAIDQLVAAHVIMPGSPKAVALANAIETAKKAYNAASAAQRVGNASSYAAALLQVQGAVAQINELVKGTPNVQ